MALSEDTELDKRVTGGRTSRIAVQLLSMWHGYRDAGELTVVKLHLVLQLFLRLGAKKPADIKWLYRLVRTWRK